MNQSDNTVIGIDLGTTYSTVAYVDSFGDPVSIVNSVGDYLTPSAILFESENVVCGKEALKASAFLPFSYADCFKRFMGRNFPQPISGAEVPAQVLAGFLLAALKEDAERMLGPIAGAVITVPAYFDDVRRQSTFDAAQLAGLKVLDIINEPTAAAVSHGYTSLQDDNPTKTILVYDLGGGTFDVTVLEVNGANFVTIATDGDVMLGGKDFDQRIVDHLAETFLLEHGVDPRNDPHDLAQLWLDADEAKRSLSQRDKISQGMFYGGKRSIVEINRAKFEELTADLLARTEMTIRMVMQQANLDIEDIDDLLAVGGASRMPMVHSMLGRFFKGCEPVQFANPDLAIGHGAALLANSIAGNLNHPVSLVNVNSHSLGVIGLNKETNRRVNATLISKNTTLPFTAQRKFTTAKSDQRSVVVTVVEGESEQPENCLVLGRCKIEDLPRGLPADTSVIVEFSYDTTGRLAVSANLPATGQSTHAIVARKNASSNGMSLEQWAAKIGGGQSVDFDDTTALKEELHGLLLKIANEFIEANPPIPQQTEVGQMMLVVLDSNLACNAMEQEFAAIQNGGRQNGGHQNGEPSANTSTPESQNRNHQSADLVQMRQELLQAKKENQIHRLRLSRLLISDPDFDNYDMNLASALMEKLELISK